MRMRFLLALPLAAPAAAQTPNIIPTCKVGETLQLTTLVAAPVTWVSRDTSVFTVDQNGLATCKKAGTANAWATNASGQRGTENVRVLAAPAPVPPPPPADTTPVPVPTPTPTPTPAGVFFRSDWSTATGNTENAVRDGGRWTDQACAHNDVLQVVTAPASWTRTPNVLRVTNPAAGRCWQIQTSAVPEGVSYYIRFYAMVESGSGANFHPTALEIWGTQGAPWSMESVTSTTWQMATRLGGGLPYADYAWKTADLRNGIWYRFEYHIELLPNQRFRIWPRVYDMAGALIADATTMHHLDGGARTLAQMYASGTSSPYTGGQTSSPARAIANFAMGYADDAGGNNQRWYHAAVALCSNWCGPLQ